MKRIAIILVLALALVECASAVVVNGPTTVDVPTDKALVGYLLSTVPDPQTGESEATRLRDALCRAGGYQDTIPDENGQPIPNPETRAQFANRMLRMLIINWVLTQERNEDQQQAIEALVPPPPIDPTDP